MDKVIIDGVDVSECEHYRAEIETKMPYGEYEIQKDKCYYSGIEIIQACKGIKGCIYKQLKRLEQENKELKQENERLSDSAYRQADYDYRLDDAEEKNEMLEQENEQLKADIESRTMCITCERELQNCNLQAENERLKAEFKNYKTSKENSYQNLKKEWQQLQWNIRKLTTENEHYRKEAYRLADGLNKTENLAFIYKQALQEIREIVSEPCIVDENCQTCNSGCMQKDILDKINEVIGAEE